MSTDAPGAGPLGALTTFCILAALAGIVCLAIVYGLLLGLCLAEVRAAKSLVIDDLVVLLEAAWAAGAASFLLWGAQTRSSLLLRHRSFLIRVGTVAGIGFSWLAFYLAAFFLERQFGEAYKTPSARCVLLATFGAVCLAAIVRPRFRDAKVTATRGP